MSQRPLTCNLTPSRGSLHIFAQKQSVGLCTKPRPSLDFTVTPFEMALTNAFAHLSIHKEIVHNIELPGRFTTMLAGARAALAPQHRHHKHDHARNTTAPERLTVPEVILISDDEDHGPKYERRRMQFSPPSISSSDSSDYSDAPEYLRQAPVSKDGGRLHKRPKLQHPSPIDSTKSNSKALPSAYSTTGQAIKSPKEFTTAIISFRGKAQGDDRATLTFRQAPSNPAPVETTKVHESMAHRTARVHVQEHAKPDPKPYQYDPRLEINLYCGPGYQQFPVVLGSVEGHEQICAEWDLRDARRQEQKDQGLDLIQLDEDMRRPNDLLSKSDHDENAQECLREVLQIFPQISRKFLLETYRGRVKQHRDVEHNEILELPSANSIVSELAELEKIPSQAEEDEKQAKLDESKDATGFTVKYDKTFQKNGMYYKEVIILLARFFAHIPTHYIAKRVHENKSLFEAHLELHELDANYYTLQPKPYSRARHPRQQIEKKYMYAKFEKRDGLQYINIVNEFQAARQQIERNRLKVEDQKARDQAEVENLALHKAEGSIIECGCCFDDEIPMNRAVSCQGVTLHFFCYSCVSQLAETQIGMMRYEMNCMDGSGCKATLITEGIGKAVTIKVFDKLAFYQQQAEVIAAGIEGLEQCPFCDFKAICDPTEAIFFCQNPDCSRSSCRKCHEASHLPKTCEEAKKEKGLSARHLVEEARSEAMIRVCPKCQVKIVKEYGCNKMICTKCGCKMCYTCRADISSGQRGGYEHFNAPGAKCKLYDEDVINRHQEEADEAERQAVRKVREQNQDVDEDMLRVDLDKNGRRKDGKTNIYVRPEEHRHHRVHDFPGAPGDPFLDEFAAQHRIDVQNRLAAHNAVFDQRLARRLPPVDAEEARYRHGNNGNPRPPPPPANHGAAAADQWPLFGIMGPDFARFNDLLGFDFGALVRGGAAEPGQAALPPWANIGLDANANPAPNLAKQARQEEARQRREARDAVRAARAAAAQHRLDEQVRQVQRRHQRHLDNGRRREEERRERRDRLDLDLRIEELRQQQLRDIEHQRLYMAQQAKEDDPEGPRAQAEMDQLDGINRAQDQPEERWRRMRGGEVDGAGDAPGPQRYADLLPPYVDFDMMQDWRNNILPALGMEHHPAMQGWMDDVPPEQYAGIYDAVFEE